MRRWLVLCCVSAGIAVIPRELQATVRQAPPPRPASSVPDYLFPSGSGLLLFHVRPDRAAEFEAVIDRLKLVLDSTVDETRRRQATSWRIFRSVENPRDEVIYVFVFDPAVVGADYDPIKVLSEAAPAEISGLYERLRAAVIRVERMGLAALR